MATRQTRLPLARAERLALIDAVDPALAGISTRRWRTCRDLLKQVEFLTAGGPTIAIELLEARLAVHRATVLRAAAELEGAGLLARRQTRSGCRQGPTAWSIDWARVAGSAPAHRPESHGAPPESHGAPPESHGAPARVASCDPYKGISSSTSSLRSSRSTVDGGVDRKCEEGETDPPEPRTPNHAAWDSARLAAIARRIEARVGRCRSERDWLLACKAAALAERLGEAWLWDAVEGVARRRADRSRPRLARPWAYLWQCLDEGATRRVRVLRRELAAVTIPEIPYDPPADRRLDDDQAAYLAARREAPIV